MASGAAKVIRGAVLGTGSLLEVRQVGFRPRTVQLINIDSADELYWTSTMVDGGGLKRLAAGAASVLTADGVTPLSDGFSLGADSDLNVDGETVHFEATE